MHLACSKLLKYTLDLKVKGEAGEEKPHIQLYDCYANFSSDSYFIIPQWFKHLRAVEIYFWNREALIVSGRRVSLVDLS